MEVDVISSLKSQCWGMTSIVGVGDLQTEMSFSMWIANVSTGLAKKEGMGTWSTCEPQGRSSMINENQRVHLVWKWKVHVLERWENELDDAYAIHVLERWHAYGQDMTSRSNETLSTTSFFSVAYLKYYAIHPTEYYNWIPLPTPNKEMHFISCNSVLRGTWVNQHNSRQSCDLEELINQLELTCGDLERAS
jgi:hypothetical protein